VPVAFATGLTGRKGGAICSVAASVIFGFVEFAGGFALTIALWNSVHERGLVTLVLLLPPMIEKSLLRWPTILDRVAYLPNWAPYASGSIIRTGSRLPNCSISGLRPVDKTPLQPDRCHR